MKNKSLKEVFDYVADFANISQWDPGCLKSEKKGMVVSSFCELRAICTKTEHDDSGLEKSGYDGE